MSSKTEIVTAEESLALDLSALADSINESIDLVTRFEESFNTETLEPRLLIGLEIARAQEKFTLTNSESGLIGGSVSRVTRLDDPKVFAGFSGWLKKSIPRLKRPRAYKYAEAFRSLGLPVETTSPREIREAVKTLRHEAGKANKPMPTLASIIKAGHKEEEEPITIEAPKDTKAIRIGDARESLHTWKLAWTAFVKRGCLDDLPKGDLEELKDFILTVNDQLKARMK